MKKNILLALFVVSLFPLMGWADTHNVVFHGNVPLDDPAERELFGKSLRYEAELVIDDARPPYWEGTQTTTGNEIALYYIDVVSLKLEGKSYFRDFSSGDGNTAFDMGVRDAASSASDVISLFLGEDYWDPISGELTYESELTYEKNGVTYLVYVGLSLGWPKGTFLGTGADNLLFLQYIEPWFKQTVFHFYEPDTFGLSIVDNYPTVFSYGSGENFYSRFPLPEPYSDSDISFDFCLPNTDYENKIHLGTDIHTPNDNPSVYPVCNGEVVFNNTNDPPSGSNFNDYFNRVLVIEHQCGGETVFGIYGHIISQMDKNDPVSVNVPIGNIAQAYRKNETPNPYNNHLHFGLNRNKITNKWGYAPAGASCTKLEKNGWIDAPDFFDW